MNSNFLDNGSDVLALKCPDRKEAKDVHENSDTNK